MVTGDEELVRGLLDSRGEEAIRGLYRAYGRELYGFALQRLDDAQIAEEAVQDIFTRVWRSAGRFDPRRGTVRTWLYAIARNAIIDAQRRREARPPVAGTAADERSDAEQPIEDALRRWQVRAAVDQLRPEHRQVLELAYFGGMTLREIAERTGVPLGTVKRRASYGLRSLRLVFEEMGVMAP